MRLPLAFLASIVPALLATGQEWKPVQGTLTTRWAKDVDPKQPWPDYPRPTMVRKDWQNLNGLWEYSITAPPSPNQTVEPTWEGKILVPYPVESALSGVGKRITKDQVLHYRRTFEVPAGWRADGQRVVLHFGAVDWHCAVSVNGAAVGEHKGGYDGFSFDITAQLKDGPNQIRVDVDDPGDSGGQPRGKQWDVPRGIWYTPSTGIWQTVWIEPTPATAIAGLKIDPDAAHQSVVVSLTGVVSQNQSRAGERTEVDVLIGDKLVAHAVSTPEHSQGAIVKIPDARLWSPEDPFLYDLRVRLMNGDKVLDQVTGYCGLRDVNLMQQNGINRLALNAKPTFMFGPLDQGFWPDGLYTPPTEEAMKFDIEAARKMGCNMLRKHVKVECERFYYWCDKMGVMVWQDMPSPFFRTDQDKHLPELSDAWKANFETEMFQMIRGRMSHPSIVMWVPFNEGWGQNDLAWAKSMVDRVHEWDPSRLVDCATGWTDTGNGNVLDIHVYPGPATPAPPAGRAAVLGEFGGLGLPVDGHTWVLNNNWGYVTYKNKDELTDAYCDLMKQLPPLIAEGLSAAVYTQTTDVEIEVNGWMTYDRAVWKVDAARAAAATKPALAPPATLKVILPHAGQPGAGESEQWRYTTQKPDDRWFTPEFDAATWQSGRAGFGTAGTPGAVVGTEWKTDDIWLRRSVTLAESQGEVYLSIHHDEDAEVYVNGELAASVKGYTTGYTLIPVSPKASEILRSAKTAVVAVHCHQTKGGQFIDVGFEGLVPATK